MIDSHCHLNFNKFDGRRDELVAAASEAGVHTIVNIGIDLVTSRESIDLAERFDNVYATVGIHPHDSETFSDEALRQIREWTEHSRVRAVGEIGLDYYRDYAPRPTQQRAFQAQLELAGELRMPIVIHTRAAFRETVDMVRQHGSGIPGGIFHCFPGDERDAAEVVDMGFVIGVGGSITYKKSKMARTAAAMPLDKIVLETDAPFITPEPHRGKPNQPAYIAIIARKLAELQGVPIEEVEKLTDRTCQKIFGLVDVFG